MADDIRFLKEKVAAGASFLITQLFFDNDFYFDFLEEARGAGITVPIIPGIMPVTNFGQIKRFTEMCGASIPEDLERELAARADDADAVVELGVAYATLQCSELLARGAPGIHFYTLNRSTATRAILAALRAARPWDRTLAPA
jgi:methylenetetrahydrofolate reductase (NADPH)